MYEVTLQTSGLMQIGWATLQCQVTVEVIIIVVSMIPQRDILMSYRMELGIPQTHLHMMVIELSSGMGLHLNMERCDCYLPPINYINMIVGVVCWRCDRFLY